MIIMSDVPEVDKAITSVLPTSIAIRYDRLMRSEAPAKMICPYADDVAKNVIWIDLPRGSRWRASKLATLQTVLKDVVQHRSPISQGRTGLQPATSAQEANTKYLEAAHRHGM